MTSVDSLPRMTPDMLTSLGDAAPSYDRARLEPRILHIGPGAFFRAHQADYVDRLNALDPVWGITGLSLRSTSVSDALRPQGGLYTLVTLDEQVSARVIGSLIAVHHAGEPDVLELFGAPELRLITLTITEKGYCLGADGSLDVQHADIQADLAKPDAPTSAIGWLVAGLELRRTSGLPAPIILSCDNLSGNGEKLRAAVLGLARLRDEKLADWIEAECLFPSSMVDSITPATDDALRARVRDMLDVDDAWPIQREAFTDWVIERMDDPRMPAFDKVGAVFTDDVDGFEQAKLRLLNGPHSTLAYYGLARGFASVSEAISDPEMNAFIAGLMRTEIAPTLNPPASLDLDKYQADLIRRFANPAIVHKLSQIAWDGSKKLPIRLLATMADNLAADRSIARLCVGVAAWWRFVIRATRTGGELVDPLADKLQRHAEEARDEARHDVALMLSLSEIFPERIASSPRVKAELCDAYSRVLDAERRAHGGAK